MKIDLFTKEDIAAVLTLLSGAGLPIEDLSTRKLKNFLVARSEDGSVVGVVGLERYQEVGLLRSLVVHPSQRGKGLREKLTGHIETLARRKGIGSLFLLTTTATEFFPRLGYKVVQRSQVPKPMAQTDEFQNICPVSAVCFYKLL